MIVIGLYIALHRHYLNFYLFLIEIFVLAGTIRAKSMVVERRKTNQFWSVHEFDLRLLFRQMVYLLNSLTPMSDQDRISPYNINTISTR